MKNIVLFGPPGAGKGTQAEIIKQEYDLFHISTGDVFRYNIKNNTDLGLLAKGFMDKGELVPDQITIDMLSDVVEKNSHVNGFIFDGFPRNLWPLIIEAQIWPRPSGILKRDQKSRSPRESLALSSPLAGPTFHFHTDGPWSSPPHIHTDS